MAAQRPPSALLVTGCARARAWVRAVLEKAGYEVLDLASSAGASRVILRSAPDLVLVDITGPAKPVVEIVRASGVLRRTRIILFGEHRTADLESMARELGADGCVRTEVDLLRLIAQVQG